MFRNPRIDPFYHPPSGDDAGCVKGLAPGVVVDAWIELVERSGDRQALDDFMRRRCATGRRIRSSG